MNFVSSEIAGRRALAAAAVAALALLVGNLGPVRAGEQDLHLSDWTTLSVGRTKWGSTVFCGPDGQVFAFVGNSVDTGLRRSFDFGRTFDGPTLIPEEDPGEVVGRTRLLYVENTGRLTHLWLQQGPAGGERDLTVNVSEDWGATWLPRAIQVNEDNSREVLRYDSARAEDGTMFLTYADRDLSTPIHGLWFTRSLDGGYSFDPPAPFWSEENARLTVIPRSLLTSVEGDLVALIVHFDEVDDSILRLYARTSFDDGATFADPVLVDPVGESIESEALSTGPGGLVHVVWAGSRNGSLRDVFYARSTDHGLSFAPPVRLDTSSAPNATRSRLVSIASGATGHVVVSWLEGAEVHVNASHDGGASWDGDESLGAGIVGSGGPRLSANGSGHVALFWQASHPDGVGVMATSSRDHGVTWLPAPIRMDLPENLAAEHSVAIDAAGRIYTAWDEESIEGTTLRHESFLRSAFPTLGMSAVARNDSDGVLVIPPEGLRMEYDVTLRNHHPAEALAGLTVWLEAKLPSGRTVGPLAGPFTVTIAPGTRKRKPVRKFFPGAKPAGVYELVLRTSGAIDDAVFAPIVKQ